LDVFNTYILSEVFLYLYKILPLNPRFKILYENFSGRNGSFTKSTPGGGGVADADKVLAVDGEDHVAADEPGGLGARPGLEVGHEDARAGFRVLALDDHDAPALIALLDDNLAEALVLLIGLDGVVLVRLRGELGEGPDGHLLESCVRSEFKIDESVSAVPIDGDNF
jgi:hypothetical protein